MRKDFINLGETKKWKFLLTAKTWKRLPVEWFLILEMFLPHNFFFYHRSQRARNVSEKKRRDKLNMYITQLASLLPPEGHQKKDKSSVLKHSVEYLKHKNGRASMISLYHLLSPYPFYKGTQLFGTRSQALMLIELVIDTSVQKDILV